MGGGGGGMMLAARQDNRVTGASCRLNRQYFDLNTGGHSVTVFISHHHFGHSCFCASLLYNTLCEERRSRHNRQYSHSLSLSLSLYWTV